jgi:hypothetical protein
MTTDRALADLLTGIRPERMAGTVGALAAPAFPGRRADPSTLAAVCRLVVATAWLAATHTTTLLSLIGDRRWR